LPRHETTVRAGETDVDGANAPWEPPCPLGIQGPSGLALRGLTVVTGSVPSDPSKRKRKGLEMRELRKEVAAKPFMKFVSALFTVGLIATLPAAAIAAPAGKPIAHKAGSGAAPILPSIVRVRIARGEKALERAGDYVDQDQPNSAVASLLNARRNMYAAWRGAKYLVEHAPPPPPPAGYRTKKAKASGAPVAGTTYATPEETAMAVLGFQHTVATASYGLLDGAKGVLRDSVSTTMFAALNARDQAIEWIHNRPAPPPPAAYRTKAHASGAPVATGFDTLMPNIIPDLEDEITQIEGVLDGGAVTTGEKRILNQADVQVIKTERKVNTYWPPPPPG
jgi:hypothetical protein